MMRKKNKKKQAIILPKKTKFKKLQKGSLGSFERKITTTQLYYGLYGLKILKSSRLNSRQLEAARRQISKQLKKQEFLWIRVIADIPVTKKPIEIRMGKGKGSVAYWIARAKAGQTIFELTCMLPKKAQTLLLNAAKKLSVPCALIKHIKKT
jgi:large subunit ribosomal protein L16